MLIKADTNPKDVLKLLSGYGISAAFLVPTETGMEKSIMDATAPVRDFLREQGIHDYGIQQQGKENKVLLPAEFILSDRVVPTQVSLYRPETKSGDPRIWFYGLKNQARQHNLLALVVFGKKLFVLNASDVAILDSVKDPASPLGKLALQASTEISPEASELLGLLRSNAGDRFIPSIRSGDTGVGATLEDLLGIKANSSKAPDFKGIELKASRQDPSRNRAKNRVNLFSQVPDWKLSPIGSARKMLDSYGYTQDGRLQLYCTLDAIKPNSQKLMLEVDGAQNILKTIDGAVGKQKDLMLWAMSTLKARMSEKHPESFWVKAESRVINGKEHFRYYKAIHTVRPILSSLDYLLGDGTVTLDLTMSEKGVKGVRDHGYLFKIWPEDFGSLFPPPKEHSLI